MQYDIYDRYTEEVQFTAEIEADESTPDPWKKRLAVLWAIENNVDLSGANLSGINMSGASLIGANLRWANLRWANLNWASLRGARLPTGEVQESYLAEVVPALLTAGGKTVEGIVDSGAWDCHGWSNCPMHAAFGASSLKEIPTILRPRAEQFIQLFDARLIPCPETHNEETT